MGNNLQIFNNINFGRIRIVDFNNQTYFVARDVALALGYTNPMKAIRDHCKGVNETFILELEWYHKSLVPKYKGSVMVKLFCNIIVRKIS